jgi:hypothetical protein
MKHKGEVFQHFFNFKIMMEKEKGVNIKSRTHSLCVSQNLKEFEVLESEL